ncbi:hypothetical protein RN001_003425 [Aquatica leii]|uniref:Mos1 transposase HTH domain-containing protein n=1 Tax=Aquatica leii TaxID=1421715 RepID=A0AAN7PIA5_9COLE|nr:hypothetical protein RN001_003425 [Aquatica leii]
MIFYDFRRGLNQQQCADQVASTFGDEAPYRAIMFCWFSEFHRKRTLPQDEFREGRSKSAVVPENIDAVRKLILQDCHGTYREIEAYLGISSTCIHSI